MSLARLYHAKFREEDSEAAEDRRHLLRNLRRPLGDGTRVELTHSGWEKLGDAAAGLRERCDRGWGRVFERSFVDYANSAAT